MIQATGIMHLVVQCRDADFAFSSFYDATAGVTVTRCCFHVYIYTQTYTCIYIYTYVYIDI